MSFLDNLKEEASFTETLNGAKTHSTSGDACLDLFAVAGGMRHRSYRDQIHLFDRAYIENPELAMKLLFYIRDIREGLGERELFRNLIRHTAKTWPESARKNISLISEYGVSLVFTLGLLGCGVYNYHHPETNVVSILTNKRYEDTPQAIKIVAISDVHLGNGTGKAALKKYVEMINAQHPNLILISGDLIDNSVVPLYTENMAEELANLKAPMGIYMVLGNHEYISGIDESIRYIKSTQIQLLRDSVVTLPNGIQLIGRDDRHNRKRHSLQELMVNIDKSKPIILLDHQPFDLEKTEAAGIDLQFSGHTHHGQIWPINWVTDYIFEQSHGYRQWGNSHVYVSSGLSLWGPPFRIGTHSEMVIFNFQ